MHEFPIPVRTIGPGSQPVDDTKLDVLEIPRSVATFEMPRVPEAVDPAVLAASRDVFAGLLRRLEAWDPERDLQGPCVEMSGITPAVLAITNQMLGEGEVSIQVGGERHFHIQESVFTGLWRCCEIAADGALVRDWLEAAIAPQVVIDAAHRGSGTLPEIEWPPGAMNSPALVAEINSQLRTRTSSARAHAINLTLLPLTPDDHRVLEHALPVAAVAMISRGFGNCRVTSTAVRNVWRVQYFNSMNTLILDTLEVVDLPEAAQASTDDLTDSRVRLAELVQWLDESCAEAAQPPA
jgi:hydrogenase-1 operon protein HyaF